MTVKFSEFFGHLNLGEVSGFASDQIAVVYEMNATVGGFALNSEAIAAINDPFALSTDPVIEGVPIFPEGEVIVHEPSSAAALLGLAVLGYATRRRGVPRA